MNAKTTLDDVINCRFWYFTRILLIFSLTDLHQAMSIFAELALLPTLTSSDLVLYWDGPVSWMVYQHCREWFDSDEYGIDDRNMDILTTEEGLYSQ